MGKLSSKSHKNENNTYLSFYQVCLPKLYENILKTYKLNLFKEISISFKHGLQANSKSPASFPDGVLV